MDKSKEEIRKRLKEVNDEIDSLQDTHGWSQSFKTMAEAKIYSKNNSEELIKLSQLLDEMRNLELSLLSESERIQYLQEFQLLKYKDNSI